MNIWKKYKLIFGICIILIITSIIFCYIKLSREPVADKNNGKIKIGLSLDSLVVERWSYDRDIFLAKAKQLGADVIVQNANNDSDEQVNQIKFLISQRVDVLVIVPNDSDALAPVVGIAKKKGIKVISYDRIIRNGGTDLYVSIDNENVGNLMASSIVKKVPRGNYIIIDGSDRDYNAVMFNKGFYKILKPLIKRGDIKIVKEVWARSWNEKDAYNCVEEVLSKGIKIDGIIAANDRLAEAVIQVLAEHRLAGKVPVVGGDAALAGCQRIVENIQLMTAYKPIKTLAQSAAIEAVRLVKGEELLTNKTINDGKYNIPVIMEKPTAVNKDNMVDIIVKNNFHTIEDIYRNVPKSKWPK
jgi:D-xylose transport system substrate-binding protein